MQTTTEIRIKQYEMIRIHMFGDLERVSKRLEEDPDQKLELMLLSRKGKLYDQIMSLDNKLKREYKILDKELEDAKAAEPTKQLKIQNFLETPKELVTETLTAKQTSQPKAPVVTMAEVDPQQVQAHIRNEQRSEATWKAPKRN